MYTHTQFSSYLLKRPEIRDTQYDEYKQHPDLSSKYHPHPLRRKELDSLEHS